MQFATFNRTTAFALVLIGVAFSNAVAASADEPAWTSLAVYPPEITLSTADDYQRVVVVATRADGVTADVTGEVEKSLVDEAIASFDGAMLRPKADGATQLVVKFAGLEATIPVTAASAAEERPVSFMFDVMPVFTRAGCNTGSCHGTARGKDGFRISLVGSDPKGDYHRITREEATRRINLAVPTDSLLLEKSTGAVQHTGGKRFGADSQYYDALRDWLAAGATSDADTAPTCTCVAIYPPAAVLEGEATTQQLIAVATYSTTARAT